MSDTAWPRGGVVAVCRWLLRRAAGLLPAHRAVDWLAEWEGELWALRRRGAGRIELLRFALGALSVARWERGLEDGVMSGLGQDLGHAVRRLRRSPGFALVIVAVLALGIGVNTALLSALRATLAGSPYPDAERLVIVDLLMARMVGGPRDTLPWSYPKFELLRERMQSVYSLAGYSSRTATLTGDPGATRIGVEFVSPSYFELLGVRPVVGRIFLSEEDPPASAPIVILSHGLWMTRYGGDPGVIGRTVQLDGGTLEVVGVLPVGFRGVTGSADVWVPMAGVPTVHGGTRRLTTPFAHWLRVIGRLPVGMTIEQARAEAAAVGGAITETYPFPSVDDGVQGVTVVPFLRARTNPVTRLAVTAVSVGGLLLLLIACANVAGLLLARASARQVDSAVRAALGAGRLRLVRESLAESLLLAAVGGGVGLFLAHAAEGVVGRAVAQSLQTSGTRSLQFFDPQTLAVDATVLAGGVAVALLTGLVFGALPARAASRPDLAHGLRAGDRALGGRQPYAWRGLLVAGQLALTLVLLAGAGLMAASFARLSRIDVGFTHDRVLTVRYEQPPGGSPEQSRVFEQSVLERLNALPGVQSVAFGPCPPLTGACEITGVRRIDDRAADNEEGINSEILTYAVSDEYFRTLGIAARQGRTFDGTDALGGPPVAVINEAAARRLFAGVTPLGRRIAVTHQLTEAEMAEIIGVVADVRYGRVEDPAIPALYFARRQAPSGYGTLYVRTSGDPLAFVDDVRREIAALEPDLALYDVTTMADRRAHAVARTRVVLGLLAAFAVTGLLLSAVGLYGTVSYAVVRRTREMGLRVALGAPRRNILRVVLAPPLLLVLSGAASGILGALTLHRFAEALLFGVEPTNPVVLAAATALLLMVAGLAACVPALRATRVDPATALRSD